LLKVFWLRVPLQGLGRVRRGTSAEAPPPPDGGDGRPRSGGEMGPREGPRFSVMILPQVHLRNVT